MDTSHGKRSAYIDLDVAEGRAQLRDLVGEADIFIEGYRGGSLAGRGFGPADVAAIRPGVVYVSINCYGHVGPWASRPGWEQLAQTATGIAVTHGSPERPRLLPAAACDYTTGYLAAFGAMTALARQAREGGSWHVKASLCQTAMWIQRAGANIGGDASGVGDAGDLMTASDTPYGRLTHLRPVVTMSATTPRWELPSVPLGTHAPVWDDPAASR
jgi:crotonobetainyl-CoA:carnitine CoA-transferase CaiB-like acyl-CoA transferase